MRNRWWYRCVLWQEGLGGRWSQAPAERTRHLLLARLPRRPIRFPQGKAGLVVGEETQNLLGSEHICFLWKQPGPGRPSVVCGEQLFCTPHPSTLTNGPPTRALAPAAEQRQVQSRSPAWGPPTLLLGQQTEGALLAWLGRPRLMEQVQAGWDNHLA